MPDTHQGGTSAAAEIIGMSHQGRPIVAHYCGSPHSRLRILVIAGQHGDESEARLAALDFLAQERSAAVRSNAIVAIVADANPDGAAAGTRLNADGIDLNRDHLLLAEPETRAIHDFVARWRPLLVVDIHTYRPRRKELLRHDLVFPQEVLVDYSTNPTTRLGVDPRRPAQLLNHLRTRLAAESIRCERYTLVRPSGIVRHSTTDIVDARNGLSLRFGVFTVLLEGRRSSRRDPPQLKPARVALKRSLEVLISWTVRDIRRIQHQPAPAADPIPVNFRYSADGNARRLEMLSTKTGKIREVAIPGTYLPRVRTTLKIQPPHVYAVPCTAKIVIDVLQRHRFLAIAPRAGRRRGIAYRIVRPPVQNPNGDWTPPVCTLDSVVFDVTQFVLFPIHQPGGRVLTVLLEPVSKLGLHRFDDLKLSMEMGMHYPILRTA